MTSRGSPTSDRPARTRFLCLVLLLAWAAPIDAHYLGESYLFLSIRAGGLDGHLDMPLAELGDALFEGEITDGVFTPQELETEIDRVRAYAAARLRFSVAARTYPVEFTTHRVLSSPNGDFVQLEFEVRGLESPPTSLTVEYSVLFSSDPNHRGLLLVEVNEATGYRNAGEEIALIFTRDSQVQELDLTRSSRLDLFLTYLEHGVFHIAIGVDHILFIVALLLSAVLEREGGRWVACASFRRAFLNIVTIVTLFTAAHSMTLSLAALQIVTLPGRLVESMIAVTVIAAAAHNLFPVGLRLMPPIIFVFGLFHGFGFAAVLTGLGLRQYSLVATLFGFNLGVEVGQLVVVGTLFPVLFWLRNHRHYVKLVLGVGSALIAAFGVVWLLERALGSAF